MTELQHHLTKDNGIFKSGTSVESLQGLVKGKPEVQFLQLQVSLSNYVSREALVWRHFSPLIQNHIHVRHLRWLVAAN